METVVTDAATLTPGAVQLADQFAGDEITFDPSEVGPDRGVTGVSSTTAAGTYGVGSVITITVGWA